MAVLATQDDPWFEVSDIELKRPGLSYSAETLQALHRMYGPACELFFLIGADRLVHIDTWRSREEIFERAQVVVVPRSGVDMDHTPAARRQRVICLPSPRTDISSTNIRRCVQTGHSIRNLVPSSVEAYIRENRLYMT